MKDLDLVKNIIDFKEYAVDDDKKYKGEYTYPLKYKKKLLKRYNNLSMKYKYYFK